MKLFGIGNAPPGPVVTNPISPQGNLGDGTITYIDADGEVQTIPNTFTPPYGEPPLETSPAEMPYPGTPQINPAAELAASHDAIHGADQYRGYIIEDWQNPSNPGIPNLGPVNDQEPISARSAIIHHYPSDEQGWGLDPAIRFPRYPHSENVFPEYGAGIYNRNGDLEFTSAGIPFGNVTQQASQLQFQAQRALGTHMMLLAQPAARSLSSTVVPVGGSAGPLDLIPAGDEAIYE